MRDTDTLLMNRAIELARRGAGLVSPNPMVGAVLVNDGRVVGEGYHRYGLLKHAESYAIDAAGKLARGATLYCNLEPCCHHGRTPPCTDSLIEAGIARAVIAVKDPDPRVNGRGIEQLREAGIEIDVGVLEERAQRLNESYFKYITTGRPFVHGIIQYPADSASSLLDWQPSIEFLEFASRYDAVMIGNRPELNKVVVADARSRERHRPLVIAASNSEPWLLDALEKRIGGEITVVPVETNAGDDSAGNVVSLEKELGTVGPVLNPLLLRLTRIEVTSLLILPGLIESADTANFGEFDKVTIALPRNTFERGFATRWVFGDIEFDLENVTIQQAGEFTELTGYPSLQEVA